MFTETKKQKIEFEKALNSLKKVKGAVMPALQKAQEIYGYIPEIIQERVAKFFSVPIAEVHGVVSFYSQFLETPKGKNTISVCMGTACYVLNSQSILDKVQSLLNIKVGETTKDNLFTLQATRCIGCCGLAPAFTINEKVYGKLKPDDIKIILDSYK